ncbi:hypothetical protein CPB83DRAFT_890147 [Crepidotus variabilis]|uniref:Polysaccharide lyase 14 domain-containing protein n=1 Tax=Crepidotus variabilis TaxID=179855 RepID=A0A9P6ERL8_9AGAR|nr:hypothetical protein CPB83DRAFT_890147 [Crepidotus variabilis]
MSGLPIYVREESGLADETTHPTVSPLLSNAPTSLSTSAVTTSYASTASPLPSLGLTTTVDTLTEDVPDTITITAPPVTATETFFAPSTRTQTPGTRSFRTLTSSRGLGPAKTIWAAPALLTDLSSFQVSKLAGGERNMRFVADVSLQAQAKPLSNSRASSQKASSSDDDGAVEPSSLIQLLFPAGSIDPGQTEKPQGGTQFYASPIELSNAKNVTLEYSVFFPEDFDWVLGGKLPGLYGGHTGCSGGNAAIDCFSTRLMWRERGAGELYLYAPKDKQTNSFCNAEGSACNEEYGLSLGRGSFTWKLGSWTTIRQTVVLNTPGKQNGVFKLEVNTKTRIHRDDVVYRGDISGGTGKDTDETNNHTKGTSKTTSKQSTAKPTIKPPSNSAGGLLGPLIGGLLGSLGLRDKMNVRVAASATSTRFAASTTHRSNLESSIMQAPNPILGSIDVKSSKKDKTQEENPDRKEVKFAGIFFSTFFGGHDEKYATPKDQYIWLKDFAVAYNA